LLSLVAEVAELEAGLEVLHRAVEVQARRTALIKSPELQAQAEEAEADKASITLQKLVVTAVQA